MKKFLAVAALALIAAPGARAADVALIYASSSAVVEGHSWPALVVDGGAALPSDLALGSSNSLLYGDAAGLFRAAIARLDTDLNIAIVRKEDRVGDAALQSSHAARFQAEAAFLKLSSPAVAASSQTAGAPLSGAEGPQPFAVKIDGAEPGDTPIVVHRLLNKAKIKVEVINTSTSPVWSIQLTMNAEPPLSFWKADRRSGLNDVPTKTFEYKQQAIFSPIRPGQGISVLVDVYFIKERDYIFHLKATSKDVAAERKALVRFE